MREIELKLLLEPGDEERLAGMQALRDRAIGPPETRLLESTYFDTPDGDFRAARIAVRLRKSGAAWIQTVKKADGPMVNGLSSPIEAESLLEGPALALGRIADHDLREEVIGLARRGLAPVAETRFERTRHILRTPLGGRAELAIDIGEVRAGGLSAPLREAELELLEGEASDLYALAGVLFTRGPVRFSAVSKSERALRLAERPGAAEPLRKHRPVVLAPGQSVETAAIAVLTENFAHAAPNIARLIDTEHPSGPHQLRVGLRRLRSALQAFRPALGRGSIRPWAGQARDMAGQAGRLRDLDVLTALVHRVAKTAPGEAGFQRLLDDIAERRHAVRTAVRAALAAPAPTAFCFDFPGFLARRGWRGGETGALDAPVAPFARHALARRWKALVPYGARIEALTIDERHEMRKEMKKLRYTVDTFQGVFDPATLSPFQAAVKRLQKAFGALNDAAMAELMLTAADAPGAGDMAAQRAAGRVIGHLDAEAARLWPEAVAGWGALSGRRPFWKQGASWMHPTRAARGG